MHYYQHPVHEGDSVKWYGPKSQVIYGNLGTQFSTVEHLLCSVNRGFVQYINIFLARYAHARLA